jgi:NAD-dependent dihydropyrimidine dehydrogenase PreA subunit
MHHTLTQALYEMFPRDEKGDFHHAYLYLKHLNHFMYHALKMSGSTPKKPEGELGEDIDDLLAAMVQGVAETAASRDTSTYHGKVVRLKDALQLVSQKKNISLEPSETVIPYKQARSIILQNPESIAVGECACRAAAENSCLPEGQRDVCLFVGDPHASFIGEFNEGFHKISQDEAVFKKDVGRRFVAICNCCACCCQGMKAWNLFEGAIPVLAPSGYLCEISDECTECGLCVDACGFDAIKVDEDTQGHFVDKDKCMGCGVCEDVCLVEAISLRREPSKGQPLDLAELLAAAPA